MSEKGETVQTLFWRYEGQVYCVKSKKWLDAVIVIREGKEYVNCPECGRIH